MFSGLRRVMSATLLSRVLGMARDIATAQLFGLGPVMDAFAFAFRIPNLARRLFGEGALSAAFLPAFSRELERTFPDRSAAWQLASAVFTLLAVLLVGMVLIAEAALYGLSLAYHGHPETQLLLGLTAVMLPYAVLICVAAQVSAVLHALGHFTWPAFVPVILNVCWLTGAWLIAPVWAPDRVAQAYVLAFCIVAAGGVQIGGQWAVLRQFGFRFDRRWMQAWDGVRDVARAVLPVTLGLSITQINTFFDSLIAWGLSQPPDGSPYLPFPGHWPYPLHTGAVSALYYGERLYQFPLGVFGVALGTVLFPMLSRHVARGELHRLRDDVTLGLRLALVVGLPASVGLALIAMPITHLLLEHGEFSSLDAARTASMIAAYSSAIWAYCAIPLLFRGFYALGDRTAPVRVAMLAVVCDQVLNLTLIWPLAERGLAWSTAVSAVMQVCVLVWLLQKRTGRLDWGRLRNTIWQTIAATAVMSLACMAVLDVVPAGDSFAGRLWPVAVPVTAALVAFLAMAWLLRMDEIGWLFGRGRENAETRD